MSFKRGERGIATCYPQSTYSLWNSIFQWNMVTSDIQKDCPSKNWFLTQYPLCHSLSIAMAIPPSLVSLDKKGLKRLKKDLLWGNGNFEWPPSCRGSSTTKYQSLGYKWAVSNEKGEPVNSTLRQLLFYFLVYRLFYLKCNVGGQKK